MEAGVFARFLKILEFLSFHNSHATSIIIDLRAFFGMFCAEGCPKVDKFSKVLRSCEELWLQVCDPLVPVRAPELSLSAPFPIVISVATLKSFLSVSSQGTGSPSQAMAQKYFWYMMVTEFIRKRTDIPL
uniref:Uncharacterized protein n=1 Tax=Oryza sativa subsp. japonica TaxID=39947 RepID=Q6Z9Y5_ORYSJ|nr:hypothetical protein [Oryza sativa Japonica Group]BAD05458.1 hypothetical protein [Oryza sativa Japonica Group]